MKQVVQTLRTGVVEVEEVPIPALQDSWVLVRNTSSVISAGTEKTKIDMGKKNLIQKALSRPDLVSQVVKKLKTEGLAKTFQTVSSRLDSPSPLGYSSAGVVVAVGGRVDGIRPGDRVACGGAGYANHAELVAIPKNLVVKLPDNIGSEAGAFATLGSIALQGIRLAKPQIGERFLVLGLGLLGQITVQLLRANGCQAIGMDLNSEMVKKAEEFGAIGITPGSDPIEACMAFTEGRGVDGVLICAGTSSNDPIELCGEVTREKGRVVVVGAVKMDIPREPYFKKEISVVISRSYGPGRYDPDYEEGGRDYPFGYVRFTEQRNMQTFLDLISQGKIDVASLITHRYSLDQAPEAYGLIEGKRSEPYLAIILSYAEHDNAEVQPRKRIPVAVKTVSDGALNVSFFGAGNYATASLLPPLKNMGVNFNGLATASGRTAQGVASQFGFGFCASEFDELLGDDTDLVMIATRHDTHASSIVAALGKGKHVFVEKPLGLSVEELRQVDTAYRTGGGAQLLVGFNRRFSPLAVAVQEHFVGVSSPRIVNIRVNAGSIPTDHWIQDPKQGGGRIIGEGCHFVDLACAFTASAPVTVHMFGSGRADKSALLNDNVVISIMFANGSVANVTYVADGSKSMAKERIEVFGGGRSAVIEDFKEAFLYVGDSGHQHKKLSVQDKGQKTMLKAFINSLKDGSVLVPYEELALSSLATVCAVESMMIGAPITISLDLLTGQV